MSLATYIVLDRDDPGFDPFVDGKAAAHAFEQLDALAGGRLSEWISADELGLDLPEDVDLPEEQWFEPRDGIAVFRSLRQSVEANASQFADADDVLDDLDDYLSVLEQAAAAGCRFHLALDL